MIHFSCDLCGQPLDDRRFEVRLEIVPTFNPEHVTEDDLTEDNLQQVAEALQHAEESGNAAIPGSLQDPDDCSAKAFRYDLCSGCFARYAKDPLGRDALRRLNFSKN